jgi:hypothetical protein
MFKVFMEHLLCARCYGRYQVEEQTGQCFCPYEPCSLRGELPHTVTGAMRIYRKRALNQDGELRECIMGISRKVSRISQLVSRVLMQHSIRRSWFTPPPQLPF